MPLLTIAPKVGATGLSAVGGTASSLVGLNSDYRTLQAMLAGSTSLTDRTKIKFSATEARTSIDSPSGYTQKRNNVTVAVPLVLANGSLTFNSMKFDLSVDINTTVTQIAEMRYLMAQFISSPEADAFFNAQAVV